MNKFVLMIFSVTIFFLGVGGVVKQITNEFFPGRKTIMMIRGEHSPNERREFRLVQRSQNRVLLKNDEKNREDFQIKLRTPDQPGEIIEFERQPAPEVLKEGVELPRVSEKDPIIFFDKNQEQIGALEPAPQIRVFIDKENKKQ